MASAAVTSAAKGTRVLVSGASGLIGRALVGALSRPSAWNRFSPQVYTLVRRAPENDREIYWDPYEMRIDMKAIEGFDAVVHLAGENVGSGDGLLAFTGRWTDRKKHRIIESRRRGTQLIAQALAATRSKPNVLVSASGVGFYGDTGSTAVAEDARKGKGFLSDVSEVWEASTAAASAAGIRVVNLRLGVVLAASGGALAKMYTPFFMGAGGVIGSGQQYMSWLSLEDAVRIIEHAIHRPELSGPVNACSPGAVTNAEFVRALGRAMSRPTVVPMPEVGVRALFGEMGEETLLTSVRAHPKKLMESGFRFMHESIDDGVVAGLRS